VNVDFPCKCGHNFSDHYDPDDESSSTIISGEGRCNIRLRSVGHWCTSCGDDPSNYCPCHTYRSDNLKYLEELSGN
jgi:hypothetical protein